MRRQQKRLGLLHLLIPSKINVILSFYMVDLCRRAMRSVSVRFLTLDLMYTLVIIFLLQYTTKEETSIRCKPIL